MSVARAAVVKALVFEPMANMVNSSTGVGSPSLRTPYPLATTIVPSFTMATAMPGTLNVFIDAATEESRSGGGAVEVDWADAEVAAASAASASAQRRREALSM